jgi:TolB-like protein
MKRRHVVRFALGYAAAAFVLLQLAEIVFPAFGLGETGLRVLVIAVALLFPPAVVMAWVFDITTEGIKRTQELPTSSSHGQGALTPRLALLGVTLGVVGATAIWIAREGVIAPASPQGDATAPADVTLAQYDPTAPIRSLAVLPLDNFAETGEQDYFSAGMHEELIAQLSQIGGLRVVSRTSVSRYAGADVPIPQIGRDLQVDAVIEGSVRRDDDRVRITVQLIDAASDTHIWTQQYDRSLEDVFALQSEVALDIATQIQAELSTEETTLLTRTASMDFHPEAQDAYLRGRFEYEKGTLESYYVAMEHFEEAVGEDSTFAPALAGLAGTRFLIGMTEPQAGEAEMEQAAKEAMRALELDSMSMEAKEVLTLIRHNLPEGVAVENLGEIIVTTAPDEVAPAGDAHVRGLRVLDTTWATSMTEIGRRIEEAVRHRNVDPGEKEQMKRVVATRQLMSAGLFSEAASMLEDLAEEEWAPPGLWQQLARARISAGDGEGAVEALDEWRKTGDPGAPNAAEVQQLAEAVDRSGVRGYWTWSKDRLEALRASGADVSPTEYAASLVALGETERAFEVLDEAVSSGDRTLMTLQSDPVWDAVRGDPRFAKIARGSRAMRFPGPRRRPPSVR